MMVRSDATASELLEKMRSTATPTELRFIAEFYALPEAEQWEFLARSSVRLAMLVEALKGATGM